VPGVLIALAVLLPFFDRIFPAGTPRWALGLILVTTCLELSTEVLLAYVRAREKAVFFATISLAKLLVQCGANFYFVRVAQQGVGGVISGNLLAVGAEWLLLAGWGLRHTGLAFHWHKLLPVLRYCLPFLLTTLVGVVQGNFDRFLAGTLISLQALGLYAVAQKFSRVLVDFVGIPFSLAYGGFRFEMMKSETAPQTQGRIVLYLAVLLSVLGLAMIYLIDDVLRLMTDPQYWPAAQQMPFLVSASVLGVLITPAQTGILYAKQSRDIFYINVLGATCGLTLAAVLAPTWGITGLAVAVMVNNAIQLLITARWAHAFLPAQYPRGPLVGLAVLWVGFNLAPWLLERYAGMSPSLAQDAILWLGFVLALPATGVIPASDLLALRRKLRRGG
jgi:O-antigen/teichoic acid export membrane protein